MIVLARILRRIADAIDPCDAHIIEQLAAAGLPLPKGTSLAPKRAVRFRFDEAAARERRTPFFRSAQG